MGLFTLDQKIEILEAISAVRGNHEPATLLSHRLHKYQFTYQECWMLLELNDPLPIIERGKESARVEELLERERKERREKERSDQRIRRKWVLARSRETIARFQEILQWQYRPLVMSIVQNDEDVEVHAQAIAQWADRFMESFHDAEIMDDAYLLIRDGGAYVQYDETTMLRREHAGSILTSCAPILEHAIRYRATDTESKGLREEEGLRRTISQAITGSRSQLPNNRLRRMTDIIQPYLKKRMRAIIKSILATKEEGGIVEETILAMEQRTPHMVLWDRHRSSLKFIKRWSRNMPP